MTLGSNITSLFLFLTFLEWEALNIFKSDKDLGALLKWFKQQRSLSMPIGSAILVTKAKHLAKLLGYGNFACSNNWINWFKSNRSLTFCKVSGDNKGVDDKYVQDWLAKSSTKLHWRWHFQCRRDWPLLKLTPDKTI